MTTDVSVPSPPLRTLEPGLFAGITDATWTYEVAAGVFTATFDADLDAEAVEAVRDRLLTDCSEREALRGAVRADRDALDAGDPLRRLYDYVLGDVAES